MRGDNRGLRGKDPDRMRNLGAANWILRLKVLIFLSILRIVCRNAAKELSKEPPKSGTSISAPATMKT